MVADQRHGHGGVGEHIGVVGVQLERPEQLPTRAVVVAAVQLGHAKDAMSPVVAVVELDRPAGEIQGFLAQEEPMVPGEAGPFVQVGHGEPHVGARELGILRHRLLEAATGLANRREISAFQGAPAAQPEVVGHQIVRPCPLGRLQARVFDAADQHRDDAARHLVLDVEKLAHGQS